MAQRKPSFAKDPTDRVSAQIERAAPQEPPCFDGREQWVAWLQVAATACDKDVRPLMYRSAKNGEEKPAAFNHEVDFCRDCTSKYRTEMQLQERCRPDYVRRRHQQAAK